MRLFTTGTIPFYYNLLGFGTWLISIVFMAKTFAEKLKTVPSPRIALIPKSQSLLQKKQKMQKCAFLLKSDSLCLMLGRIDA